MKHRLLNRIYAILFGYSWNSCPSCGVMFGSHENLGNKVILKEGRLMPYCPSCEQDNTLKDDNALVAEKFDEIITSRRTSPMITKIMLFVWLVFIALAVLWLVNK